MGFAITGIAGALLMAHCVYSAFLAEKAAFDARRELAAYQAELDYVNSLTPEQLIGNALDALTAEGADEDDLAAIIADVRAGNQE